MKRLMTFIIFLSITESFGFGIIGHRIVGEIAQRHLKNSTRKKLKKIAGLETLAMMANWPDFMKSDPDFYKKTNFWHFVTIPDGQSYDSIEKEPKGDVVESIKRMKMIISDKNSTKTQKLEALRFLVHFVGDIHQPLHVGKPGDRGGNDIKVKWMGQSTNLHHVWDEEMIMGKELSFTEYANELDHGDNRLIRTWMKDDINVWIKESMELRNQAYSTLTKNNEGEYDLGYKYSFDNIESLEKRMLQAGVRLAELLNKNLK